jgi:hypothetical protein
MICKESCATGGKNIFVTGRSTAIGHRCHARFKGSAEMIFDVKMTDVGCVFGICNDEFVVAHVCRLACSIIHL